MADDTSRPRKVEGGLNEPQTSRSGKESVPSDLGSLPTLIWSRCVAKSPVLTSGLKVLRHVVPKIKGSSL